MTVAPEYSGNGCTVLNNAHTQWPEITVHHIGMTTAWPPNKITPGGPGYPDIDLDSERERPRRTDLRGGHCAELSPRRCQCASWPMAAVRFFKSSINGFVWRGLGTVAGGEVIGGDAY